MENEEWDEGFGAEEFISFDEDFQNTMKIILHQRVFQDGTIYKNIITTEKYHYQFNYQKKIKNNLNNIL